MRWIFASVICGLCVWGDAAFIIWSAHNWLSSAPTNGVALARFSATILGIYLIAAPASISVCWAIRLWN